MARRTRLFRLAQNETSGVDHPANASQLGGAEGWIVMKADGTPLGERQSGPVTPAPTKEAPVELAEQLAKAQSDLTAATARIEELTKAVADAQAEAATKNEAADPVAKALETLDPKVAEMVRKSQEDAAQAIAKAQKLEDEAADRSFIAKAAELDGLSIDATKFGPHMRSIFEKCGAETGEEIVRILKGAGEIAKKSDLFRSVGTGVSSTPNAYGALAAAADDIRKSDPSLTQEQAISKAAQLHPELRAEYAAETSGRR